MKNASAEELDQCVVIGHSITPRERGYQLTPHLTMQGRPHPANHRPTVSPRVGLMQGVHSPAGQLLSEKNVAKLVEEVAVLRQA